MLTKTKRIDIRTTAAVLEKLECVAARIANGNKSAAIELLIVKAEKSMNTKPKKDTKNVG